MKPLLSFLALFLSVGLAAQTFCLRLSEVSNNGSNYVVRIEIQGAQSFNLGSSNLQWSFNSGAVQDPVLLSSPLAPPLYQVPTVTTQGGTEASFNIELGFPGFGTSIAAFPAWTELGTVAFAITDPGNIGLMEWSYNGGTTQTVVFLDDEATQIFATTLNCLQGTGGALPVELLDFQVHKSERAVDLRWSTAVEVDNEGFAVLRSKDAQEWERIDWIAGMGQSQVQQAYQSRDEKPYQGSNYYRLEQVDFDGRVAHSPIRSVHFEQGDELRLSPNPAEYETFIQHPANEELAEIVIYDQMGQEIRRFVPNNPLLAVGDLANGVYFVEIWMKGERRYYQKLLIQRP